jgi:hypothetical protein
VVALVHVLNFLSFVAFERVCPFRDEVLKLVDTKVAQDQKVSRALSGSAPVFANIHVVPPPLRHGEVPHLNSP